MPASRYLPIVAKPFLRWAGGKSWLLRHIPDLMPSNGIATYHEPFLGGGAVFFGLVASRGSTAVLSDLNGELIETYVQVRDSVDQVIEVLGSFENTATRYYEIREWAPARPHERAARFIFLNQTSFNGIFRVNRAGVYNVPYGYRSKDFIDAPNLRAVSAALQSVLLLNEDFEAVVDRTKPGDLVFLDPPYTVSHSNNGFVKYNSRLFSISDQHRLARVATQLNERGAHYLLTNAAHETIAAIFDPVGRRVRVERASRVGGRGAVRGTFGEYLFTNVGML